MANSENFTSAIKALHALTSDELNALVPFWKQAAKIKRSMAGDAVVQKAGFKFSNMNRALTCVVGMECDASGKEIAAAPGKTGKWTVAVTLIDQVNGTSIAK